MGLFWDPIPKNVAIWLFLDHILRESTEDEIKLLSNQLGKELQLYQSGLMHVLGNCGQSTPLFCNLLSKCIHFAYLTTLGLPWLGEHVASVFAADCRGLRHPAQDGSAIIHLTGETFDALVKDEAKDVMVLFHAPWCGYCQRLMPAYEALAGLFNPIEVGVAIAAIDADKYGAPVEVTGFPTMYFVPANAKANPVRYQGPRELEAMVAFLEAHTTTSPGPAERNNKI